MSTGAQRPVRRESCPDVAGMLHAHLRPTTKAVMRLRRPAGWLTVSLSLLFM